MNKIYCLGVGYKPLNKKEREIILSSDIIILSSHRFLEIFSRYKVYVVVKDKIKLIGNVNETINFIRSKIKNPKSKIKTIVLLASGDPLFFGIGRKMISEFGKDMIEIHPDLSSIQLAFSRIKEPWDDALLMSLHGSHGSKNRGRLSYKIEDVPFLIQHHNKIAILTDKENNPAKIAEVILGAERGLKSQKIKKEIKNFSSLPLNHIKIFVCEKLGYPNERIVEGTPKEISKMSFAEPNVVIIQRSEVESKRLEVKIPNFGLTEDEIVHSRGLITKDEVRAVTIHKLRIPQKGVFWDIGAGSGSVSIEIALLYPDLKVFAIEKDEEQINNIKENIIMFHVSNIYIIKGESPEVLKTIPSPDRVFIGGSGGRLTEIINFIANTNAEIVVVNAATIETLHESIQCLEHNGFKVEVSEIAVSRSKIIANKKSMSALNPVFVIRGKRESSVS